LTDTFLAPIEQPKGLIKKLAYYFTRRQFGKVLTPVKVHSARLPPAFGLFYAKVARLDEKLQLPPELVMLVRQRVAQINVCLFCIDIGRWNTIKNSMDQAKFDALDHYGTSPLFSDAERAALDYVTELTKDKKVDPDTFARLARHYSERAICEIVWLVASEHLYNMTNIGLNIHSDMLCDISRKRRN
jgi:alkylhydroperoxidase family enzyme